MEDLLRDILGELQSLNTKMDEVIKNHPLSAPIYTIDDIFNKIGEAAAEITGPTGYNLGDVYSQLVSIESAIDTE